jgi:hypothetical protein
MVSITEPCRNPSLLMLKSLFNGGTIVTSYELKIALQLSRPAATLYNLKMANSTPSRESQEDRQDTIAPLRDEAKSGMRFAWD